MLSKKEYLKKLNSKDRAALNLIILPAFKKHGFRLKAIGSSLLRKDYGDIDLVVFGNYFEMKRVFLECGKHGANVSVDDSGQHKDLIMNSGCITFCSRYYIRIDKSLFHILVPAQKGFSLRNAVGLS